MKLIHAADSDSGLILLYETSPHRFEWFKNEKELGIFAESIQEAIRLGAREIPGFRTLLCGYKYTLPERDEHGNNALFSDMIQSLNSSNGVYFDEKRGFNCIVQNIPAKAISLYNELKSQNKLYV